jgi:N-acetylglucosamine-6-phosphate deacetylase
LQIYGSGGFLFGGAPSTDALNQMEIDLCSQGTTGFLATIATNSAEIVEQGFKASQEYKCTFPARKGNYIGLHLEGPYISPIRRGAHPVEYIEKGTAESVHRLLSQNFNDLKMMTLAPECVDADVLELLHSQGIIISSGHSNASYRQGKRFLSSSPRLVTAVTHLYNAMPPMHHREPSVGYIPAIFEERPFTSIVVDGVHVDYTMVRLAKRELGDKLFLITDSVTGTQTGLYPHILQEEEESGRKKYVMPDGTLSGSSLSMLEAVKNCVQHCQIALPEAINMASFYPAQVLGMSHKKGRIERNYVADLCVFSDNYEVELTFIGGRCVYNRRSEVIEPTR